MTAGQKMTILGAGVVAVALGLLTALGWWARVEKRVQPVPPEPRTTAQPAPTAGPPREERSHVARFIPPIEAQAKVANPKLEYRQIPLWDETGWVNREFAEKLGLDVVDVLRMQDAMDQTKRELDILALANATFAQQGGKFVITVHPFDGTAQYERLMDHLAPLLGPKLSTYGDEIDARFYGFGAEIRTYEITRTPNGGVKISQVRKTAEAFSAGEFEFPSLAAAREKLAALVELVPP